jgi:hypothetical protein
MTFGRTGRWTAKPERARYGGLAAIVPPHITAHIERSKSLEIAGLDRSRMPVMARSVGAERGQGVRVMCAYQAIEDREMGGC